MFHVNNYVQPCYIHCATSVQPLCNLVGHRRQNTAKPQCKPCATFEHPFTGAGFRRNVKGRATRTDYDGEGLTLIMGFLRVLRKLSWFYESFPKFTCVFTSFSHKIQLDKQ